MKTLILSLVVLLLSGSEALRCYCRGQKFCSSPVESCSGQNMFCASVVFHAGARPRSFKSCMNLTDCLVLEHLGFSSATCCSTDLCN